MFSAISARQAKDTGQFSGQKLPNRATLRRMGTHKLIKSSAQESSRILARGLEDHFKQAQQWLADGRTTDVPVLAIRSPAGVGKSEGVLQALSKPAWSDRRGLYLVPTIALAEELAVRARTMGINARVIRGRSQVQPGELEAGAKMCAKNKLAESLSALGMDVTNTLCRSAGEKGEPAQECEHAKTCPYLAQLKNKASGLLIACHNYIPLTMERMKAEKLDYLIVDESFWRAMCREGRVQTSQFQLFRGVGKDYGRRKGMSNADLQQEQGVAMNDFEELTILLKDIFNEASKAKKPLTLDMFRQAGFTPELCAFATTYEYSRLGRPEIKAGMNYELQAELIKKAKVDEAFGFARIWKILNTELALPRNQLLGIVRDERAWSDKAEGFEDVLRTYYHPDAKLTDLPLILIDADLDEDIAKQFYPVASKVLNIDVAWSNVFVRQVLDRAVSRSMLAGDNKRPDEQARNGNRREDLWYIASDMSARHGHPVAFSADATDDTDARKRRPLIVTYKSVEDAWIASGRIEPYGAKEIPLRNALPFDVAHLGDIRGKDGWKHATGVIVAGRLEPQVSDVEKLARQVFFADERELTFIQPDDEGNKRWNSVNRAVSFRDGTEQGVSVSSHPDPRCDSILRQIREAELLQAVGRIRPVHRQAGNPCEIVIATNVPLDGVLVDEAVIWDDLVPDRIRRMELEGVVPDLSADCASAYPDMFSSASAVRQARSRSARARFQSQLEDNELQVSGCDKSHLDTLYGKCHTQRLLTVRVNYKRRVGGLERSGSASVRYSKGESEADVVGRLTRAVPDAYAVTVLGTLPDADEEPERLAQMHKEATAWLAGSFESDEVGSTRPPVPKPATKPPIDDRPDPFEADELVY